MWYKGLHKRIPLLLAALQKTLRIAFTTNLINTLWKSLYKQIPLLLRKDLPSCPLVHYNFLNQRRCILSQIHPEALPKYFLGPSYILCVKRDVSFLILCDIGWHAGWPWRIIGTHTAPPQDVQLHIITQTNIASRHTYIHRQTHTGRP